MRPVRSVTPARYAKALAPISWAFLALGGCAPWAVEADLDRLSSLAAAGPTAPAATGDALDVRADGLPGLGEDATLPDYLRHAALANPGLRAEFERFRAAVAKAPQARALPDPGLGFGYFVREVETRVGPQRAKVGLSQTLPWKGKRALRGEVAARGAAAARARYEAARLALFHRVKVAYWRYWYLSRAVEITRRNVELMTGLEGVARAKYAAGRAPHSAVMKAQVELGRLEERLAALRDRRGPASARLSAAVGRPSDSLLPWPVAAPEADAAGAARSAAFGKLIRDLEERSPVLEAAREGTARAEAAAGLARLSRRPDVGVGVEYVFTGERDAAGDESGADAVVATFSMSLPFANRGKYRAAEREAEHAREAASLELAERRNELSASLREALFDLRDSERKIELYGETLLSKARQSLEVARSAFEGDRADFLDLVDAERTLLEFELAHARAGADRAVALARIEMLVGGIPAPDEAGDGQGNAPE